MSKSIDFFFRAANLAVRSNLFTVYNETNYGKDIITYH